jgi:hypothetical protein
MQNPKSLSELLAGGGNRITTLKARSLARALVLEQVCAALPARLAQAVASAGIEGDRLTIGVAGAVWASRLRYFTEPVRKRVSSSTGIDILRVRVRVVPIRT